MKFREFFSAPEGKRITEKYLYKVLISSICSILLCMGCLAGTTWAWFTVSIENEGNVIRIEEPEIRLSIAGEERKSGVTLESGEYKLKIEHANELDDFQKKSTLYVTLTTNSGSGTITRYTVLDSSNEYSAVVLIQSDLDFELTWDVSWIVPPSADVVVDNTIIIEAPVVPETPEAPADESENESSDSAEDPSGETETPSETPSEETETDPTEGTAAPTGTGTDPTKETTADTESSEVTSQPAESESEPAETEAVTE